MKHFVFFILLSCSLSAQTKDTIFINNYFLLKKSIKSDRVIVLKTDHIKIPKSLPEFVIKDIKNLTIVNKSEIKTRVTTSHDSNTVIVIENSENITIDNLSIGHWPDVGICQGDVIGVQNSANIHINNSDLFGSGVIGVNVNNSNVYLENTIIRDCSKDILAIDESELILTDCLLFLNKENKKENYNATFKNCKFYDNSNRKVLDNLIGLYPSEPIQIWANVVSENPLWDLESSGWLENTCNSTDIVRASSSLKSTKKNNYSIQNINEPYSNFEDSVVNAWAEGVSGNGVGESLTFTITSLENIEGEPWDLVPDFKIVNGYAKSLKTWKENNRIKQFKMIRNNHMVGYVNLWDVPNIQEFDVGGIFEKYPYWIGDEITFEIVEVYKGNKYTDTCISFFSTVCLP